MAVNQGGANSRLPVGGGAAASFGLPYSDGEPPDNNKTKAVIWVVGIAVVLAALGSGAWLLARDNGPGKGAAATTTTRRATTSTTKARSTTTARGSATTARATTTVRSSTTARPSTTTVPASTTAKATSTTVRKPSTTTPRTTARPTATTGADGSGFGNGTANGTGGGSGAGSGAGTGSTGAPSILGGQSVASAATGPGLVAFGVGDGTGTDPINDATVTIEATPKSVICRYGSDLGSPGAGVFLGECGAAASGNGDVAGIVAGWVDTLVEGGKVTTPARIGGFVFTLESADSSVTLTVAPHG